jgi:hypothetical protein
MLGEGEKEGGRAGKKEEGKGTGEREVKSTDAEKEKEKGKERTSKATEALNRTPPERQQHRPTQHPGAKAGVRRRRSLLFLVKTSFFFLLLVTTFLDFSEFSGLILQKKKETNKRFSTASQSFSTNM